MKTRMTRRPASAPPAVAGMFYPASPAALARHVDALLAGRSRRRRKTRFPLALVVPHAGTIYSGPVAASAYARLRPHAAVDHARRRLRAGAPRPGARRGSPRGRRVGDAARRGADRRRAPDARRRAAARRWTTGRTPPSTRSRSSSRSCSASSAEGFTFLPVAVSEISARATADLIGEFLGEKGTLVLVSTDLSHYHDLETARRLDRATADAILAREPEHSRARTPAAIYPLRGLVELARRKDLPIELLDLRTSGDTAGRPPATTRRRLRVAFEVRLLERLTNPF